MTGSPCFRSWSNWSKPSEGVKIGRENRAPGRLVVERKLHGIHTACNCKATRFIRHMPYFIWRIEPAGDLRAALLRRRLGRRPGQNQSQLVAVPTDPEA